MKKEKINEIKIRFRALSSNEAFARILTTAFLMPYSPTVEEIADIKTAVSEAVTNAIVHGYRSDGDKFVTLSETMYSDGTFTVTVSDKGCGIPDIHMAMEPLFTTDAENERSGMGFSIMETFSDKLRVVSRVGVGTRVTMTKKISEYGK